MDEKIACKVVVWPRGLTETAEVDVEVTVRNFYDLARCPCCGNSQSGYEAQATAAYQEGEEFGRMLLLRGSSEWRHGLLQTLRDAGYLQSKVV